MVPFNPSDHCEFLAGRPLTPFSEFELGGGPVEFEIIVWDAVSIGRAKPTDPELISTDGDPVFAAWRAEHGGDPALTLRRKAKEALDARADLNTTVRAALIEIIEYAVQTAANLNALLDGIDSAVNLAQIKAAAALIDNQPTPTLAQARNAIKQRIDNGEADT